MFTLEEQAVYNDIEKMTGNPDNYLRQFVETACSIKPRSEWSAWISGLYFLVRSAYEAGYEKASP
jgi:hypothetical protein